MTITVRAAEEPDLPAVVALLGQLHEVPTAVPDLETWRTMLEQPGRTVLVAELSGDPVGDHRKHAHRFHEALGYERCATGSKLDLQEG